MNRTVNCRLQFYSVSQRPESEFPKTALKVAGMCGNGKINWASVPFWPQDWTMVCTMVGCCVIIRRPRQAFPKDNFTPLMSLNCKSTQLKIPGKWTTTFTVLLLPWQTFLLLICNCNIQCLSKASHIAMLATVALCQSFTGQFQLQPLKKINRKVKECNYMFQRVQFVRILSKSH